MRPETSDDRQYPAGAFDGTRFVFIFGGLSINPVGGVLFLDDLVRVDSLTGNFSCPTLQTKPSGRHSSAMTFHRGQLYLVLNLKRFHSVWRVLYLRFERYVDLEP